MKNSFAKVCVLVLVLTVSVFAQLKTQVKVTPQKQSVTKKSGALISPSVTLSCTPPVVGPIPTGYNFYRGTVKGGPYAVVGPNQSTCAFTDTTVQFGTTYYYVATSLNIVGCPQGQACESCYSNEAQAVIPQNPVPNPPTNLTVGTIQAGKVPLQWNAPVPETGVTVLSYNIMRGTTPTLPHPSKIGNVKGFSFVDTGCKNTCYYTIVAECIQGKKTILSSPSNIVKAVV